MIVYMIKCPGLGWYGPRGKWVAKERARIWPNKDGVRSAKGAMGQSRASEIEVVEFTLREEIV